MSQTSEYPAIPGYEFLRLLGRNLGVVYLARHLASGTLVGLTVYSPREAAHFNDQYANLARLDHPNFIRVQTGEGGGYAYRAMEHIDRTVADRLLEGPLPEIYVARMSYAVCLALEYALERSLVALVSPSTISVTDENVPKLFCDLVAIESAASLPPPMPLAFAAPEELEGSDRNEATAVYRVGAVMYAMLTGQPPFRADLSIEVCRQVLEQQPKPPRHVTPLLSRELEAICMKCLAKSPKARYASLVELRENLRRFVHTE